MNIYARFFNQDILVTSLEELLTFLQAIPEIEVTQELINDIKFYIESDMPYPKRYKIRPRVYFILIKTTATTMEEFKAHKKTDDVAESNLKKEYKTPLFLEEKVGWYKGIINFKRVIHIPGTTKFQYQDTEFIANVFAKSGNECYQRIVAYLKDRDDIDKRSQYPSSKGSNFSFSYLGESLKEEE